jgi:short-subunit dehydrogenase
MLAIITGASRGIGYSIAEIFAANGYDLLLTSKTAGRLDKASKELSKKYSSVKIRSTAFDLSKSDEAKKFGKWCLENTNSIDVIVNNAGSFAGANVHDEEEGALEEMITTNLYSAYHLTRVLLHSMMKKKSGHIFNISSIAGLKAYPGGGSYSISKFALHGFSVNLREEMKPYNIKVTTVFPGAAYTDSWASSGIQRERLMEAEDIAKMVLACTLLSPSACVEDIVMRPQLGDL